MNKKAEGMIGQRYCGARAMTAGAEPGSQFRLLLAMIEEPPTNCSHGYMLSLSHAFSTPPR